MAISWQAAAGHWLFPFRARKGNEKGPPFRCGGRRLGLRPQTPRCGHLTTAYSGPGGPEQGKNLNGASERPPLCKGMSRAPIPFPKPPLCKGMSRAPIPFPKPPLCKGMSRAPIPFPKPPLCKGRCRAAAEGLETLPDFPLPGNHSKIPTLQSAFRPPAPLAQGSLQQRLSGERNIEHIFLSIHVPRGTSPTSPNAKIKKIQSKCSPWNILGPKTPPKPPKMPKLPPKSFYCIASVV